MDDAQVRLLEVEERLAGEQRPDGAGAAGAAGAEKTFRPYDPDQDQTCFWRRVCRTGCPMATWRGSFPIWSMRRSICRRSTPSYEDERGYPPYDPRVMVKLLVYGYVT